MAISPSNVVALLATVFPPSSDASGATREERKLADVILMKLRSAEMDQLFFEEDEELEEFDDNEGEDSDSSWNGDDSDEDHVMQNFTNGFATEKEVAEALAFYRAPLRKSRSLTVMNRHFKFIKSDHDLRKLRAFEKSKRLKKNRLTCLQELSRRLWEKIREGMDAGHSLHDLDLRQMALSINHAHGLVSGFKASQSWITRWKRKYRIRSRRITTFVSCANFKNQDKIKKEADEFVQKIKKEMETTPLTDFANADQSGFLKEMHSARTLAPIGSKKIIRVAQSKSSLTHSYTVMPIIFADGRLGEKLFVVLQEPGGQFPQKGHFMAHNLFVTCGTSHIMTKAHMKTFFKECVFSSSTPDSIHLLVDSWTSFKDQNAIQSSIPAQKSLVVHNIPAGATSMIQPEDVFYFRPFKNLVRRITSHAFLFEENFVVFQRDNLLKIASLSHTIMGAPRFSKLIQYAWHAAGYLDSHPGKFDTPVEVCFPVDIHTTKCHARLCSSCSFVMCPYCNNRYCFDHYVVQFHKC